jgi:hypothetical protein
MLRRMATSVAAATALVLSVSLPALADHAEPDKTLDGNVKSCVGLVDGAYWEKSADVPKKIQHPWWTVTIASDRSSLDVKLTSDGVSANAQLAVLVKGGDETNLFLGEPGEDLLGLFAPVNESGNHADISNYTICKVKPKAPPSEPPPSEEPPTEEPPTEAPPTEAPPTEPQATETPPAGGGEPTPTASKTPVPVPTSVPAGLNGQAAGPGAGIVTALVVAILAAGTTVVGRRLSA